MIADCPPCLPPLCLAPPAVEAPAPARLVNLPPWLRLPMSAAEAPARPRQLRDLAVAAGRQRFFADDSPWNTPLPRDANWTPVPRLAGLEVGLTSWLGANGGAIAIHYATESDPLVEVRFIRDTWTPTSNGRWRRWGNAPAREAEILAQSAPVNLFPGNPYSTQQAALDWDKGGLPTSFDRWRQDPSQGPLRVHAPRGALPPPDTDGHTVLVQPDGRALELYSPVVLAGGAIWVSQMYGFTDAVGGLGIGRENGRRASMLPSYAGALTDAELATGRIAHALAIVIPAHLLRPAYVWPALAFDSGAGGYAAPGDRNALPMGARLALPPTTDIVGLGLRTDTGRMIAQAVQTFGMFVADRGGEGISIQVQADPQRPALARLSPAVQRDLHVIIRHVQQVQGWHASGPHASDAAALPGRDNSLDSIGFNRPAERQEDVQ